MKLMAIYHANRFFAPVQSGGLIALQRGRYALYARETQAEGELMAATLGWCRNRTKLIRELGLLPGATLPEIVMGCYRRWGAEFARHLEGPVATAVIDRSADRLLASRDRMGERRLFYCRHGRTVALADHPDALIDSPYASRIVDGAGLNELFALGPARTPGRTPWRDVLALEPGCLLIADRSGVRLQRYYVMEATPHEEDAEQTVLHTRALLEQAMEDLDPRPEGAMLSGGLDSTVLTALQHATGRPVQTFSVDYEGDEADFTGNEFQPERDREYAAMAAAHFSAGHRNIILNGEDLAGALGDALDARGFPGMADVDSSFLLFARGIAPFARNVLSGEGGDEMFCGYPWFLPEKRTRTDIFPWSGSMELRRAVLRPELAEQLRPEEYARNAFRTAMDLAPRLEGEDKDDAGLRALQWVCIRSFMSNLQERALCMCEVCGVQVLTPFTDDRVAQYVWNVPPELKFLNGEGKGLLRAAAADLLPEPLLRRKKSPYPKVYSAQYTQIVRSMLREALEDRKAPLLQAANEKALRQLLDADLPAGGLPWFGQLMSGPQMLAYLWQVNEWMRTRKAQLAL